MRWITRQAYILFFSNILISVSVYGRAYFGMSSAVWKKYLHQKRCKQARSRGIFSWVKSFFAIILYGNWIVKMIRYFNARCLDPTRSPPDFIYIINRKVNINTLWSFGVDKFLWHFDTLFRLRSCLFWNVKCCLKKVSASKAMLTSTLTRHFFRGSNSFLLLFFTETGL